MLQSRREKLLQDAERFRGRSRLLLTQTPHTKLMKRSIVTISLIITAISSITLCYTQERYVSFCNQQHQAIELDLEQNKSQLELTEETQLQRIADAAKKNDKVLNNAIGKMGDGEITDGVSEIARQELDYYVDGSFLEERKQVSGLFLANLNVQLGRAKSVIGDIRAADQLLKAYLVFTGIFAFLILFAKLTPAAWSTALVPPVIAAMFLVALPWTIAAGLLLSGPSGILMTLVYTAITCVTGMLYLSVLSGASAIAGSSLIKKNGNF